MFSKFGGAGSPWVTMAVAVLFVGTCAAQDGAILDTITNMQGPSIPICGSSQFSYYGACAGVVEYSSAGVQFTLAATSLVTDARVLIGGDVYDDPAFNLEIASDAGSKPGPGVTSEVTCMAPTSGFGITTATFDPPIVLQAGTPYWIVLSPVSADTFALWLGGGSKELQTSVLTSGWTGISAQTLQFAIDGTNIQISTKSPLPSGTAGVPYSQALTASGGTPPYKWTISTGMLPSGLSFDSATGLIYGAPTSAATFAFTVMLTDSTTPIPLTATATYNLTVSKATVTMAPGQELVATFTAFANSADLLFFSDKSPLTTTGSPTISAALYDGSTLLGTYTQTASSYLQIEFESVTSRYTAPNIASVGPPPTRVDFKGFNNGTIAGKLVVTVSGGSINFGLTDPMLFDAVSSSPNNFQQQPDVKTGSSPGLGAVTPAMPEVEASQTGLTFQVPQGSVAPPPQSLALVNETPSAVSYSTTASTTSGGSWLAISAGSGSVAANAVSAPLTVSVDPSGLAPGDYYGTVEIAMPAAPNQREVATVVLNVLPATANPGATVTPTGLIFSAPDATSSSPSQPVAITNVLNRSTMFMASATVASGPMWFTISPAQGTIASGQTATVQVQANVASLPAGIYRGTLTLTFPQDNVTRTVDLLLVTGQTTAPCTATQLLPVFSKLGANFGLSAAWPADVEATVVDNCGNAVTSGSVMISFSNGDPGLSLVSLQDGTWRGSWAPLNAATPAVTVTATATDASGLTGSAQVTGALQPNPNIPVLTAGEMVSAASYSAAATPSPGELVAVFGTNLADAVESASGLPLPTQIQNTSVLVDGEAMPLFFGSPGQINAVVPYDLASGIRHRAIAQHGSRLSVPQRFTLATAEPAIFTTNQTGAGQGHIYVIPAGGGQVLANSAAPAKTGDVLTIYCTGLGPVMPAVAAGSPAPVPPPLTQAVNTVSMTIGGIPAQVLFAGLAPGYTGLYQINAIVPSGVPASDQASVIVYVAGASSPPVTMAVQ